ncbi:RNA ligase RtcB family protein [Yoonia sp. BS5-3]|uniref:3'-phosphate/5'-hydroxy nucleic acid ligase n=1 Tax=Yoonia phaeophyticola TaxID=3137369 RepID=A0ABZ2V4X7_9RHOB
MGNPAMDGGRSASQTGATITQFYTSEAWIEGRAEDQLHHVSTWAGVKRIAAFPDLHPGKYGPVGCAVLADRIYPQLIGNDIGCGMSLFQLDLPARKLKLEKAVRRIRSLGDPMDGSQFARLEQLGLPVDRSANALGTIGGGNHFCEVQTIAEVQEGCDLDHSLTYLLVHSGSRGLGEATLNALPQGAFDGLMPGGVDAAYYIAAHDIAVQWARLNRQIIAERAADALRADVRLISDVPHNILSDIQGGWLHRKGAAMAADIVPVAGSRATSSYLVAPLGLPGAMASLAHGAGRRYDRSSMHGRVRGKRSDIAAMERTPFGGRVICEDKDMLIEEAPQAYKSAETVLSDLESLGVARRIATLNPLITFKKTRRGDM